MLAAFGWGKYIFFAGIYAPLQPPVKEYALLNYSGGIFFGEDLMLDYIITHISGHYMNGVDFGAIGGFMLYRILQGSIRRIMYKVEKIIVLYIAIFLGYQLYQYLG